MSTKRPPVGLFSFLGKMRSETLIASRHRNEPTGLARALLALAWALPWRVSFHGLPWPPFYNDWLMAFAAIPLALWVAWRQHGLPWPADRLALGVALLAAVPLAQAA